VKWLVRITAAIFLGCCLIIITAVVVFGGGNDCGSSSSPISAPAAGTQTAGQIVRYFESQGIASNGAAGIVGNLQQESGLDPQEGGGGLAQWNVSWYAQMAAYATSQGLSPTSMAGQLAYIVYDLRTSYGALLSQLDSAPDPGTAATAFESEYEICSGVVSPMNVLPGSLCMDGNRRLYAVMALSAAGGASTAVPVSFVTGAACAAVAAGPGGYVNPLAKATGIVWERTDQGVDASMSVGSPILALGDCTVKLIVEFYAGQPAIVCELLDGQLAGDWWYMAEQVTPSVTVGQTVKAGQQIATYAPTGTAIETGWWTPNGGYPLGHDSYNEGVATLAGADFRFLLNQLGARAGSGPGLSSGTTLGTTDYP